MIKIETFEEVVQEMDKLENSSEKIALAVAFMRGSIASEGKPRFRDFWRMKKVCFELFPSETNPIKRTFLWKEYSELLKEAHGLQEIFKEEIDFQEAQIRLAIQGLEIELADTERAKAIGLPLFERFLDLKLLEQKACFFENLKEKVIALREEILALEIRIHQKNALLEILKHVGDRIFPEYKKIVQDLTKAFEERALEFFAEFSKAHEKGVFKKEIRQYQALLKEIHVSHESYRRFRERFSETWKEIEDFEKESAEEKNQIRKEDEERKEGFLVELQAVTEDVNFYDKVREISKRAKEEIRFREHYLVFQKEMHRMEEAYATKHLEQQQKLADKEKEKKALVEEEVNRAVEEIQALLKKKKVSLQTLEEMYEEKLGLLSKTVDKRQKMALTHQILCLREAILLQGEGVDAGWQKLIQERRAFLDMLRKELNSCGLDVELAGQIAFMIEENKKRLSV